jgi:hypothetical protein
VESVADEMEQRRRELRLFANAGADAAMDPDLKARVRADLESFLRPRILPLPRPRLAPKLPPLRPPAPARRQVHVRGGHGQVPRDVDVDLSRTAAGGDDLRALLLHTTLRLLVLVEDLGRYLQGGGGDGEARAARVLCFMDGVASCCARSVARCSPCVGARRARRKENGAAFFLV